MPRSISSHRCRLPRSRSLRKRKRLYEIIIGTSIEALDTIFERVARGEHEHRRGDIPAPEVAQHVETAPAREHHIEQDEIEPLGADEGGRVLAGARDGYGLAILRIRRSVRL
jgi:hypothetical protein